MIIESKYLLPLVHDARQLLETSQERAKYPSYTHVWLKYYIKPLKGGIIFRATKSGALIEAEWHDGVSGVMCVPFNMNHQNVMSPKHFDALGIAYRTEVINPLMSAMIDLLEQPVSAVRSDFLTVEDLATLREWAG